MKRVTQVKVRFKLYKSGKTWLAMGLSSLMVAGGTYLMSGGAQADVVAETTDTTTTSLVAGSSAASLSVGSETNDAVSTDSSPASVAVSGAVSAVNVASAASNAVEQPANTTPSEFQVTSADPTSTDVPVASVTTTQSTAVAPVVTETIDSWMPDKNLQLAVLAELTTKDNVYDTVQILPTGSTVDDITKAALGKLHALFMDTYNIANLEGLQYATSLRKLYAVPNLNADHYWGLITDLAPLANLINLEEISLDSNDISDITALGNKPKLKVLSISYNHITDVSPLMTNPLLVKRGAIAFQFVSLPEIWLNSNTDSLTTLGNVVNLAGKNVTLMPYYADDPENMYQYAQNYKSTASGTSITEQVIAWTNLMQNLHTTSSGGKYGYLTYYWKDPLYGEVGYPYFGWVIQPYYINDTIGNVIINYVVDGTNAVIHAPTVVTGVLGDSYQIDQYESVRQTYNALISQGYYLYGVSGTTAGVFAQQSQNATLVFSKTPPSFSFNVHYQTETGRTVGEDTVQTGQLNANWAVIPNSIEGYRYLYAKDATGNVITNLTGEYNSAIGDITLVYELIEGEVPSYDPATLHVKYVDQNGNELQPEWVHTGFAGDGYDVTANAIDGYELISASNYSGQLAAGEQTIRFVYRLIEGSLPTAQSGTIVVKFVDQNGKQLQAEIVKEGYAGNAYVVTPPIINGFHYKGLGLNSAALQGQLIDGQIILVLVYTADSTEGKPNEPSNPGTNEQPTDSTPVLVPIKTTKTGHQEDALQEVKVVNQPKHELMLPQTDEKKNNWGALIGLGLFSTIVGLAVSLKKQIR